MDYANRFDRAVPLQGAGQDLQVNRIAPCKVQDDHLGTAALGNVAQAVAEEAVAADNHLVTPLQDVGTGGLHGPGAGGGEGDGHIVLGVVNLPQHLADLVHHPEKLGVKVAQDGQGHSLQDPGVDGAGPGAHENALGRVKFVKVGGSSQNSVLLSGIWVNLIT